MTEALRARLIRRARDIPSAQLTAPQIDLLTRYLELLARWNRAINLTALPLDGFPDETLDRAIMEPLAAAEYAPRDTGRWLDIGSGGGTPAIPLKIVRPELPLAMVESRSRKAAFLREAVGMLGLADAEVLNSRFENLDPAEGMASLVTVRAVQLDAAMLAAISGLLGPRGRLLLFTSRAALEREATQVIETVDLTEVARQPLLSRGAVLRILEKSHVPRGTCSGP